MRQVRKVALKNLKARFPHEVNVSTDMEKRGLILDWLHGSALVGSFIARGNYLNDPNDRTVTYHFTNENSAFAFKMRWA